MTSLYFTSDTHWFHANVIKYSRRPFASVEDMNEALIDNWNKTVGPQDTVWHLGDFSFGTPTQTAVLLRRLNGHKHLVLGNHDQGIVHYSSKFLRAGLFESIQPYKELKLDPLICLFHYGARVWNKSHYGSILLYGHSHGSLPPYGKSVDVGVDSQEISPEYRPYSLDEVLTYMKDRAFIQVDHHGSASE